MEAPKPTSYEKKYSILLISTIFTGGKTRKDLFYDILNSLPFISRVKVLPPSSEKKLNDAIMINYDAIIYDLIDYTYNADHPKPEEIESYLLNGGSILVTHDQWDYKSLGPLNLLGLEKRDNCSPNFNEAKVNDFDHPILSSYYDLKSLQKFSISTGHNTYTKVNLNDPKVKLVMSFPNNANDHYLTAKEIGNGKSLYWAAGHLPNLSDTEKKIFANIVAWMVGLDKK